MKVLDKFKAARRSAVPLLAITTPDPQATMAAIYNESVVKSTAKLALADGTELELKYAPVVQWDIVRGCRSWNAAGNAMLAALVGGNCVDGQLDEQTSQQIKNDTANNPVNALEFAERFYPGTIFFFLNVHRHIDEASTAQAIWNLRDAYKSDKRMLVTLSPAFTPPSELKGDIVVVDEPLPNDKELEAIVVQAHKDAGLQAPTGPVLRKAIDAVAGLAAFPAETSAAMALTAAGLDLKALGEQKRSQVSNIPGASLWSGGETFKDVVGCKHIVSFYRKLAENQKERIRLIFFMDELEKMVAGTGDTSGVSQAMNEAFLTWSQNSRALGMILLGVPGAGKSHSAKALGGEYDIPVLMASLSGVKGSHVGESEANIRTLFKTADALAAGGRILMLATCNQLAAVTPEMQARFRLGTWFFPYPSDEERAALWTLYKKRYGISDKVVPESTNWVGREIESCCEKAYLTDMPLADAAKTIVPVCRARSAEMERLMLECSGKFVSANTEGIFEYKPNKPVAFAGQTGGRAVSVN